MAIKAKIKGVRALLGLLFGVIELNYQSISRKKRCQESFGFICPEYQFILYNEVSLDPPYFSKQDYATYAHWVKEASEIYKAPLQNLWVALNVHFHMLFLDGVYATTPWGKSRFHRTNAPDRQELTELAHTISHRVAGFLAREGILERDAENSYLNLEEGDEDPMQQVLGCSVSYRIAIEPQQGRKVFTLQTILAWEEDDRFAQVAKASDFSLHAGVAAQAWERQRLERLCRYISRPAVSEKRLSLTLSGNIRYDVNGFTSVACAWMRRSDSTQNALQRWDHARHL